MEPAGLARSARKHHCSAGEWRLLLRRVIQATEARMPQLKKVVLATAAAGQGLPALAERLHSLRDQAEHLARELETLEKEARKKKI